MDNNILCVTPKDTQFTNLPFNLVLVVSMLYNSVVRLKNIIARHVIAAGEHSGDMKGKESI